MTTAKPVVTTPKFQRHFAMPDPPEREPDDMTSFNHLSVTGGPYLLTHHFGNPDTALIGGEHYISREPTHDMEGLRYPDLLIADFDIVETAAYYRATPTSFLSTTSGPRSRHDFGSVGVAHSHPTQAM